MNFKKIMLYALSGVTMVGSALATYVAEINASDLPSVVVDAGGSILANIVTYIEIIALLVIGLFVYKNMKKAGKVFLWALIAGVVGLFSATKNVMATYGATYTAADLSTIMVDIFGQFGLQIVLFASLVVLSVILVWVVKKAKSFH